MQGQMNKMITKKTALFWRIPILKLKGIDFYLLYCLGSTAASRVTSAGSSRVGSAKAAAAAKSDEIEAKGSKKPLTTAATKPGILYTTVRSLERVFNFLWRVQYTHFPLLVL